MSYSLSVKFVEMAKEYKKGGDGKKEIEYYIKAIKICPDMIKEIYDLFKPNQLYTSRNYSDLGKEFYKIRDNNKAVEFMRLAIEKDGKNLEAYKILLSIDCDNVGYIERYGEALVNLNLYDEAIGLYRKLVVKYPTNCNYYLILGNVLECKGINEEAIDCYKKLLEIDKNNIEIHKALIRLGDKKKKHYCCLLDIYLSENNIQEAISLLDSIEKVYKIKASEYYRIGALSIGHKRYDDGRKYLEKAIAYGYEVNKSFLLIKNAIEEEKMIGFNDNMFSAKSCINEKNYSKSLKYLNFALQAYPDDVEATKLYLEVKKLDKEQNDRIPRKVEDSVEFSIDASVDVIMKRPWDYNAEK